MIVRIPVFVLFVQFLFSCQQARETAFASASNIVFDTEDVGQLAPEKNKESTPNTVFKSTDGGLTWQGLNTGLPQDAKVWNVYAGQGEIFLIGSSGLYRSGTGTASPNWKKVDILGTDISNVFPGKSGPYVSRFGLGVYQEIPGTGSWMSICDALEDKRIHTVLETKNGALFVGSQSGIFKSMDGGKSWKQVYAEGMVSSLIEEDGVLVGGGRGILRSTDGGEHWDRELTDVGMADHLGQIKDRLVAILGSGAGWRDVVGDGITSRIRTSSDHGKTWERIDQNLKPLNYIYNMDPILIGIESIFDIAQAGEYLFCSFDGGIFRSADQGKTWKRVLPSKKNQQYNLSVEGSVIYAVLTEGC